MKKITLISVLIIVISAGFVFAQMNRGGMMDRNRTMISGMGMSGMMGSDIVATSDDGIVVMSFNKLYKFNRDLKLVKQVNIPFDKDHAQQMIQNMRDLRMMLENQGSGSME